MVPVFGQLASQQEKPSLKENDMAGAVYLACQMIMVTPVLNAATQSSGAANSTTKSKPSHASSDTAKQMSQLATRLLQHADQARHALQNNEKQAAVKHIDQALANQSQLASLAKSKGTSLIVPLYTEFDETSTLGSLAAAKKNNEQPNAKKTPNTYTPVTVEQASGEFTFVGLDLDKAKTRLDAAKTALHNGNAQAATDSLAAVETDLVRETEQTNFPLLAARENLGIAESAIQNGHSKEAAAALKEASKDLDTFASGNPPRHADQARNLSKTVNSYSQNIGTNHTAAPSKIDGWWHEVDNWFNQPAKSS
jgi:hypothetical protein